MKSPSVDELMRDIQFGPDIKLDAFAFNGRRGFMQYFGGDSRDEHLVGFGNGVLLNERGANDYRAITEFSEVPERDRDIDSKLGKGIGPRFCTTREGVDMRLAPAGAQLGVFALNLAGLNVLDLRDEQRDPFRQIASHALVLLHSRLRGVEPAANRVNRLYGGADVVIRRQPPGAKLKNASRGQRNPDGVSQAFMLVRNPTLIIRRIGTVVV